MGLINNIFLDTNILIRSLDDILNNMSNVGIVIPYICLEELDDLKTRDGEVGYLARKTVRKLHNIRTKGNLRDWVKIQRNNVSISIYTPSGIEVGKIKKADDEIIRTIQEYSKHNDGDNTLYTNDISLTIKADGLGINTKTYYEESDLYQSLYDGTAEVYVDSSVVTNFYENGEITITAKEIEEINKETLFANQFVILIDKFNPSRKAMVINAGNGLEKLRYLEKEPYGIHPRNLEQKFGIELLMRDEIPMVTFSGKYGSSKTFLMLGVALEKVMDSSTPYKKILLVKPPMPLDRNLHIGFKPGNLLDKYINTLGSITSNLESLKSDKNDSRVDGVRLLEGYLDQNIIQIVSIEDILGSSFTNSIILCEEMQLLTRENMEALVSRIGESSRIFLNGDLKQGSRLIKKDPRELGLYHLIKVFKDSHLAGHLTLKSIIRSKLVEELQERW